eukprot:863421-Lingulodinium_polyedra.AAC.1
MTQWGSCCFGARRAVDFEVVGHVARWPGVGFYRRVDGVPIFKCVADCPRAPAVQGPEAPEQKEART